MKIKKIIWAIIITLLVGIGVRDIIHLSKPVVENPIKVKAANSFPASEGKTIIMVYNAYNAIYPAAVDFVKKNVFPSTYPCHLCFLAFGNTGPLPEWQSFLDALPYQQKELHKEDFKRNYIPQDLQLPLIMLANENETRVMVSAKEINKCKNLEELISLVRQKAGG